MRKSKFTKIKQPIQIRDIALVSSDNVKKIEWPFTKVIELCPSKDGHIRLIKQKMKGCEFFHPVLTLIPLEVIHDSCEDPTLIQISKIECPTVC